MTLRELEKEALRQLRLVFADEREQVLLNEISYLLANVLATSRVKLLTIKDNLINDSEFEKFNQYLNRRLKREPLAYILEEQEFFSLSFKVDKNVLIPRPETEQLVSEVLKIADRFSYLVDIGCGSGAIAISVTKNAKHLKSYALDISKSACELTVENAEKNNVDVEVIESDLLSALPKIEQEILFVSNPPYIPENEVLMPDVQQYEPALALRAGVDGLSVINRLLKEFKLQVLKNSRSILFIEIGIGQENNVKSAAQDLGLKVLDSYLDFQSIVRIVKVGIR